MDLKNLTDLIYPLHSEPYVLVLTFSYCSPDWRRGVPRTDMQLVKPVNSKASSFQLEALFLDQQIIVISKVQLKFFKFMILKGLSFINPVVPL